MNTLDVIKAKFRSYYERLDVEAPAFVERREFGFGTEKKIDYRHAAFKTAEELRNHLCVNTPLYASVSVALYDFPDARPMEKKGFRGAELAFEFDAECEHGLTCEPCLEGAKQEAILLIEEFLFPDFSFSEKEISVAFSGMRGYHVRVCSDTVSQLSRDARRQVADYVQGKGLNYAKTLDKASLESGGWKGRLARLLHDFVKNADVKDFRKLGLAKKTADATEQRRQSLLDAFSRGNFVLPRNFDWDRVVGNKIIRLSPRIDDSVTLDTSKLLRLPSTLHGGSSLLCRDVQGLRGLDSFNPFRDAVVFNNPPMRVRFAKNVPEFCLKEQAFGPFPEGGEESLPEYAALFLACKGFAQFVNEG